MAKKTLIYESLNDFYLGGQYIPKGSTVVQGHPILKGRAKLFRPFVPTYGEVEEEAEPKKAEAKPEPAEEATEPEKAEG